MCCNDNVCTFLDLKSNVALLRDEFLFKKPLPRLLPLCSCSYRAWTVIASREAHKNGPLHQGFWSFHQHDEGHTPDSG